MRKYIYNFNWLLLEKVLRIVGGLFIGIWVARYLGPHDFGILSYALAFIAFFSWASNLGMSQIIVREITKYPEKTDQILGTAFFMKLIGALGSVVFIFTVITYLKTDNQLLITTVTIVSVTYIFQSFEILEFYFQANVISKNISIAKNMGLITSILLKVYFLLGGYGVEYIAIANVFDWLVTAILFIYLYKRLGKQISIWRFEKPIAKQLLLYSWPLMFTMFLITIHMRIDQVMIESMLSVEEVGIYSVAVRLSEFWYFIPTIIVSTLMPYFVNLREQDPKMFMIRMDQLSSFMIFMGFCVGVFVTVFGQPLITFVFGAEYSRAYLPLTYSIWGGMIIAQALAINIRLISEDLQKYQMFVQIMCVFINIGANVVLIPRLGINGAAIATLMTQFCASYILGFIFKDVRPLSRQAVRTISPIYFIRFLYELKNNRRT